MQSNFHVQTREENHLLHIHLYGVFDGVSAFELIETIQKGEHQAKNILVDTSSLTQTFPFGKVILDYHLPKSGLRARIHFSGAWAGDILPEGCTLLEGKPHKTHKCKGNCKNCVCRTK